MSNAINAVTFPPALVIQANAEGFPLERLAAALVAAEKKAAQKAQEEWEGTQEEWESRVASGPFPVATEDVAKFLKINTNSKVLQAAIDAAWGPVFWGA